MVMTNMRLIDVVKKTSNLDCGTFGNISDDLGNSVTDAHSPMIRMAYGYARRVMAVALYLQGVFTFGEYTHVNDIFLDLQVLTDHSVPFQEIAYSQALELMQSYDSRFTRDIFSWMVLLVRNNSWKLGHKRQELSYEDFLHNLFESMRSNLDDISQIPSSGIRPKPKTKVNQIPKSLHTSDAPIDQYEVNAQVGALQLQINFLEQQGRIIEADMYRRQQQALINKYRNAIYTKMSFCCGNSEDATANNIKKEVLARINNKAAFDRFLYEELDAAYQANFDFGDFGLPYTNTRAFALSLGIPFEKFHNTLQTASTIDRPDGPQQFLTQATEYFFGQQIQKRVATRIKIVIMIYNEGCKEYNENQGGNLLSLLRKFFS